MESIKSHGKNKSRFTRSLLLVGGLSLMLLSFVGCERKREPNKIIHNIPVDTTQNITSARAIQEIMVLMNDSLNIVVPIINRISDTSPSFPELTGPDGSTRFTFSVANQAFYGSFTFTLQFTNASGTILDPISSQTSSTTLKTISMRSLGASNNFSQDIDLVITLDIAGDVSSTKQLSGVIRLSGQGHDSVYTFTTPGTKVNFEGLISGILNGSGTGTGGAATALTLNFGTDHSGSGSLTFEGKTGAIQLQNNGTGTLIVGNTLILLD